MKSNLSIVGVGPGAVEYLYPAARQVIEAADLIIGGQRNLELFQDSPGEKMVVRDNLAEICALIENNLPVKRIAVLVSGDPGLYSLMEYLKQRLGKTELAVWPGISSLQYFCSRIQRSWHDLYILSVHGREIPDLPGTILRYRRVFLFCGGDHTPDRLAAQLIKSGQPEAEFTVGENLSYPEERIISGKATEIAGMCFSGLSVALVETGNPGEVGWEYTTPGIPDHLFERDQVPMTKEEVRAITLAKLRLKEESIVFDVGSGTGTVAVECALRCPRGHVFAVEKNQAAVRLIEMNRQKFNLSNLTVITGEAPAVLGPLPAPDRIFIGGSGGRMEEIIAWSARVIARTKCVLRVGINTVTVESTSEALKSLSTQGFREIEPVQIAISRGTRVGEKHLLQALNPVWIITAEHGGNNGG